MYKKKKYKAYVVYIGRIPGIYETWSETKKQTDGHSGSWMKGYATYDEAIKHWDKFEQEGIIDKSPKEFTRIDFSILDQSEEPEDVPSPNELKLLVLQGKRCPYCWAPTALVDSAEVYRGKSYGPIHLCRDCNAYVGCHKGTFTALGRLANASLRRKKMDFHAALDPIWKSGKMGRNELYGWLAGRMGIDRELCHGGMFDEQQCDEAIRILKNFGVDN